PPGGGAIARAYLVETTNGGGHWNDVTSDLDASGIPRLARVNDIAAESDGQVWLVATNQSGGGSEIIHRTAGASGTWSDEDTLPSGVALRSVGTDGAGHAWVVGTNTQTNPPTGVILRNSGSGSGAALWQSQSVPSADHNFNDVAFFDSNHGWAVGSG